MVYSPTDDEVALKVACVHERLKELCPDMLHLTEETLATKWDVGLGELPSYYMDSFTERFLRSSNFSIEATVDKLKRSHEVELSTRGPQSAAVEEVLKSGRFSYFGHSKGGRPILCFDFMWGDFLNVEGGLDTILQALSVFFYRKLPSMSERDIGRKATLACPECKLFCVGGSMPMSYVRAAWRWFTDNYPGAGQLIRFSPSRFRSSLFQNIAKVFPKITLRYNVATDRSDVLKLLDVEESVILENLLSRDLCRHRDDTHLTATAAIDREWGLEIASAREQGNVDALHSDDSQFFQVKNTFVQVLDEDIVEVNEGKRGRAYTVDDPFEQKERRFEEAQAGVQVQPNGQDLVQKASKKGRRSWRPSGWTRQRKKRQLKMSEEAEEARLVASTDSNDSADSQTGLSLARSSIARC